MVPVGMVGSLPCGSEMNQQTRWTESGERLGRLPVWRVGIVGGLVGVLCCVGPTVLAFIGVVSAGTAFVWATNLYNSDAWWFRLAGLAATGLLVGVALHRRRQFSVAGVRKLRWRLLAVVGIAVATYGLLYGVTTWLGTLANR